MHKNIIIDGSGGTCTYVSLSVKHYWCISLAGTSNSMSLLKLHLDIDPDDYTGETTVITFAPGETVQTVDVSTVDDNDSESTESFTAVLSNASPSNVVFITQPTATVNIADNDRKYLSIQLCKLCV